MSQTFTDLLSNPVALSAMLHDTGVLLDTGGLLKADQHKTRLSVQALAGGVSSSIFRLDLGEQIYCVKQALPKLKVASEWHAPVERVFAEIDWIKTVALWLPHNVPEIVAVHAPTGSFIMRFLDAEHWLNWKTELLAQRIDPRIAERMGSVLGQIHRTSARQPEYAQKFANAANFLALRLDPYLLECARRVPKLDGALQRLVARTQATTLVITHGDVSPKNILLNRQADGEPLLLDAECANYGDPAFDLAFLLNHFLLKAIHLPDSSGALLQCFDDIWNGYREHINWEPEAEVQTRAAGLLAALLLARVDGKSPVEYLSAANRDRVRKIAHASIEQAVDRLEVLRHAVACG